jgi:hypothetical protein
MCKDILEEWLKNPQPPLWTWKSQEVVYMLDPKHECCKCGGRYFHKQYYEEKDELEFTCICGYSWRQPPLDKEEE